MTTPAPGNNLDALLASLADGSITDTDAAALADQLRDNPAAQDAYLDYLELHSTLAWSLTEPRPIALTTPAERTASAGQRFRVPPFAYAAIAAALLAACGVAIYLISLTPEPSPHEPSAQPIATLIENAGDLSTPGGFISEGRSYPNGEYTLDSGHAQFMLTSGTSVQLRGKTRLVMQNDMRCSLAEGIATFHCPPGAEGYTVVLPDGSHVVDLGTRFTVRVTATGAAVEVIEGLVRVVPAEDTEIPQTVTAGSRIEQRDGAWQATQLAGALPTDDLMLHLSPEHGVEHDSADRVVRWKDNLDGDNVVPQNARQDFPNQRPRVEPGAMGDRPAMRIEPEPGAGLVVDPRTANEFNFDGSFTVAVWCRADSFDSQWQALITKGDNAWRLHRFQETGQISFGTSHGPGKTSDLPAESSVDDGRWHLVVAVCEVNDNEFTKRLFIDGKLRAQERVDPIRVTDAPVMIANNADRPERVWNGWIGEVAIYRRALNEQEITDYYNASRPETAAKKPRD